MLSKGIRILCYIVIGIAFLTSLIFIIYGFSAILSKGYLLGIPSLLFGIALPFITILVLYPIFALSLIENHVADMDMKLHRVFRLLVDMHTKHAMPPTIKPAPPIPQTPCVQNTDNLAEAVQFLNEKYGLQMDLSEDIGITIEKIMSIEAADPLTKMFKECIAVATTADETFSIIRMQYAVLKKQN